MRVTKKLREQAALLCQLAASNDWGDVLEAALGIDTNGTPAELLAIDAWRHARDIGPLIYGSEPWAEAESLLRTGWSPE